VVTRAGSKHLTTPLLISDGYCGYCDCRTNECRATKYGYTVGNNLSPPECLHLASLNDLTGYAGGNFMFKVGPPKPDRP
jgi:hypothetical protein